MNYSRRNFLKLSSTAAIGMGMGMGMGLPMSLYGQDLDPNPIQSPDNTPPIKIAQDEKFWQEVAAQFHIDPSFINLENGYYGIMPVPIYQSYLQNTSRVNRLNSYLLRTTYKKEIEVIRKQLAETLGVSHDEIALTRGGTEALQNLISGYNKLEPGDQVMYADLDYYSCQFAFKWLQSRRQVSLVTMNIPEPAEKQAVLDAYAQALEENPRLKLLLLTHLNNRTGLILPVDEIASMARKKGVDVIVDAAHSWGQVDFKIQDLQADFVGLSLHKWIHAPLGLGCLYIRKGRITDIDPCYGAEDDNPLDIRSRVHSGTLNIASFLTLPAAIHYHLSLGAKVKQERLRFLRDHWVSRVSSIPSIQILTPPQLEMYAGITSFRLRGRYSKIENENIVKYLFEKHGIYTVARGGIKNGDCVRVTPALFTSLDDVERLAIALTDVAQIRA